MIEFIGTTPFLFLASLLWIVLAMVIGYLYRRTIPLGYAMLFAFNGSVLAGMRFDDVFMEKPGTVQLFSLIMVYIGPVVGFVALRYWYASGTPGIVHRLAHPRSLSVRPEIRVVVTDDAKVYLEHEPTAYVDVDDSLDSQSDPDPDPDPDPGSDSDSDSDSESGSWG